MTHKTYEDCIKLLYKTWKREILYVITFDKDRNVKGCGYNRMYNCLVFTIHDTEQFLEISAQKDFGKTFKNIIRIFSAFLPFMSTCNVALGLFICKVSAHSVQK